MKQSKIIVLVLIQLIFCQPQGGQGQIGVYTLNFQKQSSSSPQAQTNYPSNYTIKSNMNSNSQMLIDLNLKIKVKPNGESSSSKINANPQQNIEPFYCGKKIRDWPRSLYDPEYVKKARAAGLRQILVPTAYGFSMYIDPLDNLVSQYIWRNGSWFPDNINLIGHVVKPGDKILNLGSQSGIQSLVMGKIMGPQGKLYIFEPYSVSNNLITKNVKLNQLQNRTTIYKMGASKQKSTATITVYYDNTGAAQISSQASNILKQQGEVQVVQLNKVDDVLPADVSLDFALLDVEKMQVPALMGMKNIISRSPNLFIMCQWQYSSNQNKNKEQALEILKFLLGKGYRIYKYSGDDYANCKLGSFYQYTINTIEVLLGQSGIDLYFMPKNHPMIPK